MRKSSFLPMVLLAAFAVAVVYDLSEAKALPSLSVLQGLPAGFSKFGSFTVTCATTATEIAPASDLNFNELYCDNMSTTSVFIGGSDVTTSNAPCYQTTAATCAKAYFTAPVSRGQAYCIVASGTQAIKCLAGN